MRAVKRLVLVRFVVELDVEGEPVVDEGDQIALEARFAAVDGFRDRLDLDRVRTRRQSFVRIDHVVKEIRLVELRPV